MAVGIAISFVMDGKINAHSIADHRFQKTMKKADVCIPVKLPWKRKFKLAGKLCVGVFLAFHYAVPQHLAV